MRRKRNTGSAISAEADRDRLGLAQPGSLSALYGTAGMGGPKKRDLPLRDDPLGTLCGFLLRTACLLRSGQAPAEMLKGILFALLPGAGLILIGKITRGAVGLGDGLCFMSFGFWWEGEQVFSLLFLSLCLLGCTGLFLICFRNGKRDLKLPFGPFILAGGVLETALGLLMRS